MTTTAAKTTTMLDQLTSLLKQASVKNAEDDQGSADTTHPSKTVDNGTQAATEGARSAENTSDVKKQVGDGSVETSTVAADGSSANSMTTAKPVGEDPSVETSSVASKPDSDETSHPAKADFGDKYSSFSKRATAFLVTVAAAQVAKPAAVEQTKAAATAKPATESAPTVKTETEQIEEKKAAAEAGKQAADAVLGQMTGQNAQLGGPVIMHVVKTACEDADRLVSFYRGLQAETTRTQKPVAKTAANKPQAATTKAAKIKKIAAGLSALLKGSAKRAGDDSGAEEMGSNSSSDDKPKPESKPPAEPPAESSAAIPTVTDGDDTTLTPADAQMIAEAVIEQLLNATGGAGATDELGGLGGAGGAGMPADASSADPAGAIMGGAMSGEAPTMPPAGAMG